MFKAISLSRSLSRRINCKFILSRTFLTEAFQLKDSWDKRWESQLLKKVKLDDFYYDLEAKFQQTGKFSAIDVDIFANCIRDDTHLDEIEDVIHKLRLSSEATNILPSTHHAIIRTFLTYGNREELMRILNDRLNYGIFPDDYCSILMMDTFLKSKDFKNAAKVAVLHMLQEDFSNPIIHYMSLHACHKFLLNPMDWDEKVESAEKEDDEEEVWVRVDYIRNPFFDGHFDLKEANDLIGKTLIMWGSLTNDTVGYTYKGIGHVLFKDWDNAKKHFESLLQNKRKIYKGGLEIIKSHLSKVPENADNKQDGGEDKQKLSDEKHKMEILDILEKVDKSGLVDTDDALDAIDKKLKELIVEQEEEYIDNQKKLYDEWEENREVLLRKEVEEIKREKRLEEVERKKAEMEKKEEAIFFFDRENELDLMIENKRVPYPKKWLGKKKKKHSEAAEYVPPEIRKPGTMS